MSVSRVTKGTPGSAGPATRTDAVEVGHQRDHQVGLGARPMGRQRAQQRRVSQADPALQQLEFLRQAERPAALQAQVVELLGVEPHEAAELACGSSTRGQVDQAHGARSSLLAITACSARAVARCPPPALKYTKSSGLSSARDARDARCQRRIRDAGSCISACPMRTRAPLSMPSASAKPGRREHDDGRAVLEPAHLLALAQRRVAGDHVRAAVAQVQQHVERSAGGCWRPGSRPPAPA